MFVNAIMLSQVN